MSKFGEILDLLKMYTFARIKESSFFHFLALIFLIKKRGRVGYFI